MSWLHRKLTRLAGGYYPRWAFYLDIGVVLVSLFLFFAWLEV